MGAAFYNSPGVTVREIDLSTVIPANISTNAAFAGAFRWGPVGKVMTFSDAADLEAQVGKPGSNVRSVTDFMIASSYLAYAGGLRSARVSCTDAVDDGYGNNMPSRNATSGSTGTLVPNNDAFEAGSYVSVAGGWVIAKYVGDLGNSIGVAICDSASFSSPSFASYKSLFNTVPGTSDFANGKNLSDVLDEVHVVVYDLKGEWTGIAGTMLETYPYLSRFSDAVDNNGDASYFAKVINRKSLYIRIDENSTAALNTDIPGVGVLSSQFSTLGESHFTFIDGDTGTTGQQALIKTLDHGADNFANNTDANIMAAYDLFASAEDIDIALIIAGEASSTVANYLIQDIAEVRMDCLVLVSPPKDAVVYNPNNEVTDVIAFRDELPSSSYGALDSGWKYMYDKYNDVYRWIPLCGDIAGLCSRTDSTNDPWWSPAGLNRGIVKNVAKLAWNPKKTQRDDLFSNGINPVVNFPGNGTVLYGDKTLLARPSAFDAINVRRLFIILEKSISAASRYNLFEFNDEFTRAQFVSMVEPFLRDVKGRRGIYDFKVVCDETNNTAQVIGQKAFVGDIYIKPALAIRGITLNFVAVSNNVSFTEVVGSF